MTEKNDYEKRKEQSVRAHTAAKFAREAASTLTTTKTHVVNGNSFYIMGISDNHNNTDVLIEELKKAAQIENLILFFLGDQGMVAEKDSKTPSHEANSIQHEVDAIVYAVKKSGIDPKKIVVYLDGNHERRIKDKTSVELGRMVCAALGIEDHYAGDSALVKIIFKDKSIKGEKAFNIFMSHGQGRQGGVGAEADKSLNMNFVKGADLILAGDTHKIVSANKTVTEFSPGQKKPYTKDVMFANPGTDQSIEEYLQIKGIPIRAVRDGEILRVQLIENEETHETEPVIDYINIRQVLTENTQKAAQKIKHYLARLEKKKYENLEQVDADYKGAALFAHQMKNEVIAKKECAKKYKHPQALKIIPLSGFNIGSKELSQKAYEQHIEKIKKLVATIAKIDDAYVILDGDMVYYDTKSIQKSTKPEDTMANIQTLAEILAPIKDKIIAYNSGKNETGIMSLIGADAKHGIKLAEEAMKTLQLCQNQAYEPASKANLKTQAQILQNQKIKEYNEKALEREYQTYVYDVDKMHELALFKKNVLDGCSGPLTSKEIAACERWTKTEIKTILAQKMTMEDVLLDASTKAGKRKINRLFPLDELTIRAPHPDLLQNILCKILELDPKHISICSDIDGYSSNLLKITDENGITRSLNVITAYKKGVGTRRAIEKKLQSMHMGADIYVSNGEEYVTKEREADIDSEGNRHIRDVIHISGGRIYDPSTVNRIYEIRVVNSSRTRIQSGIFADTDSTTITCSSLSYKTATIDNTARDVEKILEGMVVASYDRTAERVKTEILKRKQDRNKNEIASIIKKGGK